MKMDRRTAGIIGWLFLFAFVAYGLGNAWANGMPEDSSGGVVGAFGFKRGIGALLMLANSVAVVGVGVLFFLVLRERNKTVAVAYLAARITEGIFLASGVLFLLLLSTASAEYGKLGASHIASFEATAALLKKANFWAYQIGMTALGVGSVALCRALYRTKLLPPFLALFGLGAYALFVAGCASEIMGFNIGLILSIPGGLFELVFSIWLIAKGLNESDTTETSAV